MAEPALDLAALGWTPALAFEFAPHAAKGLVPGRVSLEHNHVYRVMTAEGEWLAEAAGRIKYLASGRHELPAVGDWVALRPDPRGGRAVIRAILPRWSRFSRRAAGRETHEQVLAANIDTVFLVTSLDASLNRRRLERYLVITRPTGVQPVIVLNKQDLCDDIDAEIAAVRELAPDTPVHPVSAKSGAGMDALLAYVTHGRTVALLGPSGAGKSSIVNALIGREVLATGEVRASDARGRHTSVHRQLLLVDAGGVLIDTPGLRELQLWDGGDATDEAFADIAALAGACRFRDCQHDSEPGCGVKAAVDAGTLDATRHASFLKLQDERHELNKQHEARALIDAKRTSRPRGAATPASRTRRLTD